MQNQIFLTDKQVSLRYGIRRASVWRWVQNHGFPKPIKFSPGCSRWSLSALQEWEKTKGVDDAT